MLHAWPAHGDGPLHVLLHGFTGNASAWDGVVAELPGEALGVQLPGHDLHSPAPPPGAAFDAVADALAAALAPRLADRRARLVGYSLGARLALSLLLRHPRLWERAALIGAHPGLRDAAARQSRAEADGRWEALLRTQPLAVFNAAWAAQPLFASQRAAPASRLAAQDAVRAGHDPHALADMLHATSLARMPERWSALGAIAVPCTWMAGAADAKFMALAEEAATATPGGRCVALEGCGHNPLLEAPERLAEALRAL